jgi:long-subunit fatty acid transport protein
LPTAAGGDKDIVNNSVNVGTEFPQQVLLGVQQKLTDTWMLYGQYSWTNYAKIDHITLDGTFKYTGGTATAASDLDQKWHDQHLIQVAAGYTGFFMPIYFGAEYVTAVTDKDHARLTSSPPGGGYELTLGSEYKIMENMSLSGAFEYYDLSGSANGGAAGTGTSDFREGTYTAIGYAFHLGAKYSF